MLYDPERHEPLLQAAWDEGRARDTIARIAQLAQSRFEQQGLWPMHPLDEQDPAPAYALYFGASGVIWALRHLQQRGAIQWSFDWQPHVMPLLEPNRAAMGDYAEAPFGSYLMGDTGILMLEHAFTSSEQAADEIARLVESNMAHPSREFMWGSPGTLAAAQFMHQRTGQERWAELFRATARKLWSQLEWSVQEKCHYWTQDMYGEHSDYIDGVHGFAGTAPPLIQGRALLPADEWSAWSDRISTTVRTTAEREGAHANWRARLSNPRGGRKLMQYCHGAPGFVICLGDFPGDALDDLLLAGAELTWHAGPLRKGSNLCHGTGGNGYAFLKLFRRTGDDRWLQRARAFAMHGIAQFESALQEYGRARFSLWTGDPGFAIYLWDCIDGTDRFPTVDYFFD
jgi:hypothetical protein